MFLNQISHFALKTQSIVQFLFSFSFFLIIKESQIVGLNCAKISHGICSYYDLFVMDGVSFVHRWKLSQATGSVSEVLLETQSVFFPSDCATLILFLILIILNNYTRSPFPTYL